MNLIDTGAISSDDFKYFPRKIILHVNAFKSCANCL